MANNISCCLEGATPEDIEYAAKLANAHDFIAALTDGYDTQTGEKGKSLFMIVGSTGITKGRLVEQLQCHRMQTS